MKIVCVGDCGVDHYIPSDEMLFGGITANFARHARRQFHPDDVVQIISAVGNDHGAELVLDSLKNSDIDCRISKLKGATPVQYISVQPDGERKFVRYDAGVLSEFQIGDKEEELIQTADLLVAPVYLQIVGLFDELMSIETSGRTSIDFADFLQHPDFELLEKHVTRIDFGFFGLSVDDTDTISRIEYLARQRDKLFVVTLGADGSRAFQGDATFDCPAIKVDEVVDTTGAGDAFAAGFLSRHCYGSGIDESLQAGSVLAATVVSKHGAI